MKQGVQVKVMKQVPTMELEQRMKRFREIMDMKNPDWQVALIVSKINQFYFTGTMQEGILVIPRDQEAVFWVRKSFERALEESLFPCIRPMESFRDAAESMNAYKDIVYVEAEFVPLAYYQRLQKYFPFTGYKPLDGQIAAVRSIKSAYELDLMKESGRIHRHILEDRVPALLEEGISEAEFAVKLFSALMEEGYHGITRFAMFDTESLVGQIGFGVSSIYPSYFNGPGGHLGLSPAVPLFANRERRLKKGDLVFVDVGCGVDGYHTDKTMTYMFGEPLPNEVQKIHERCVDIQNAIAAQLKPGAIPQQIYQSVMEALEPEFLRNFMGFGSRRVKFLGHGIGLTIDEQPVIAMGFTEPIQEGMVFALEPKKGIDGIGMVGIENTFMVSPDGGISITGDHRGLMPVY